VRRRFANPYAASAAVSAVFFLYALVATTNLSTVEIFTLAAFTATVVLASLLFLLGFTMASVSPVCPSTPDARCSLSESAAAGFSLMLIPLAVLSLALTFTVLTRLYKFTSRPFRFLLPSRLRRSQSNAAGKSKRTAKKPNSRTTQAKTKTDTSSSSLTNKGNFTDKGINSGKNTTKR
jgi:hypothetical protein